MEEILVFVASRFADVDVVIASEDNGAPRMAWGDAFVTYAPPPDPDRPLLLPHPVYGTQGWVCILNPSDGSRAMVEQLLSAAYDREVRRYHR